MMEKLGVVLDDEKSKTASSSKTCPKCGGTVQHDARRNVPWCVNCGTEPFEKKPTTTQ